MNNNSTFGSKSFPLLVKCLLRVWNISFHYRVYKNVNKNKSIPL